MIEPLDAKIHLAFAFDVGYEIDLDRARPLLAAESGGLARRRRTPESIQYRPAPLRVALDASGLALPGGVATNGAPRAELSVFDFDAISLLVTFPVRLDESAMLELAEGLADLAPLVAAARLVLAPWLERIRPMVVEFEPGAIGEEYVVFQLGEQSPEWLDEHTDWIAGLVRLESGPLSPGGCGHEETPGRDPPELIVPGRGSPGGRGRRRGRGSPTRR